MTLEKMNSLISNTNLYIVNNWMKNDSLNRDNKWISFLLKKH